MRHIHPFLLAVLLGSECALSLQCYSCAEAESSSPCQPSQCLKQGVCYTSDITLTLDDGNRVKYQQKGCAPSCGEVSHILQQLSQSSGPGNLGLPALMKLEVQGLRCCERDLCNGGTLPLGPGGGLLLSLGLIFLWALL